MKKLILTLLIVLVTFAPQLYSITLIEYIEQNGMPQIEHDTLDLSYKDLTDITGLQNISNINQVAHMYLNGNLLQTLPADVFSNLPNLRMLNLDNNDLQILPADVFNNLPNLNKLLLSNNQLNTLPTDIFNNLSNLWLLNLRNNQLSTLPANVFSSLPNLCTLELDHNKLQTLPDNLLGNLNQLKKITLIGNPFTQEFRSGKLKVILNETSASQLDTNRITDIVQKEQMLKSSRYTYKGLKETIAEHIAKNSIAVDPNQLCHYPEDIHNIIEQARERLRIDDQISNNLNAYTI